MKSLHYANLSRQTLSEKLTGGNVAWPPFIAGDTVEQRLRFCQRLDGVTSLKDITILSVYAAISRIDQRPLTGTFRLKIGPAEDTSVVGTNVTATLTPASTAADWLAAINALTIVGEGGDYGAATVTLDNGTYLVIFAGETAAVPIVETDNALTPTSLLRASAYEKDGVWIHDCRLIQAPVAFATEYERRLPAAPTIERYRAGTDDGATINEIQILKVPAEFNGAAVFERGGLESDPFSAQTSAATMKELLDPLADEDGEFLVTDVLPGEAWIEFSGSMAATAQDLLEVNQVRAPAGDVYFVLDLDQANAYELLREKDEVEVYYHIRVTYEDDVDEEPRRWSYLQKVKLRRPVHWDGLDIDRAIDFLKKPADRIVPVTEDQIITGSQHYSTALPNTPALGATVFTFNHNLDEDLGHFVLATNSLPGVRLQEHVDYRIAPQSEDSFTLTLLAGGYFEAPIVENVEGTWQFARTGQANVDSLNHLKFAFSTIGPKSAFEDHDHEEGDIPTLPPKLADIFSRLAALEAAAGTGVPFQATQSLAGPLTRPLGIVWRVPRARIIPPRPASLLEWRTTAEDLGELPGRPLRLLPAVHVAEGDLEVLPALLPAPSADYEDRVFYSAIDRPDFPGGGLVSGDFAACTRFEWYRVTKKAGTSSYYPSAFELTLFETAINAREFPVRSTLELLVGFELIVAMLEKKARERRSVCQWTVALEAGIPTADASPATTGGNLAAAFTSPVTLLEERLTFTEIPSHHRLGCTIVRAGNGDLTARAILYGRDEATTAPPSVPFALRLVMREFDTENAISDARGVPAVRGLDVGMGGQPDTALGKLTIS